MSTTDYFEGVLCHCPEAGEDGHPLGTDGCVAEVKKGRYHDDWCELNHEFELPHPKCHGSASGTCPECGKVRRVVAVIVRPDAVEGTTTRPGPSTARMELQRFPGMAPHKSGGVECSGTHRVPVETAYRPGKAFEEWLRAQDDLSDEEKQVARGRAA